MRERRKTIIRVFSEMKRIAKVKDKYLIYFSKREFEALEKRMLGEG